MRIISRFYWLKKLGPYSIFIRDFLSRQEVGESHRRDLYHYNKPWLGLRQCSGEKSIFFNNATNELLFGRKHCFYDLNIKMVHFCTFIMRLLWKLGKIAAILDSRRRKKRSQFWIFCYQIFNISKKLQYLQTDQRDFWNFEKKSIFLIFCQKWHKNMRFFIVFRIPFQN